MQLSEGDPQYFLLSRIDVAPTMRDSVMANLADGHRGSLDSVPGFSGGVVFAGPDAGRVATLARWECETDFLAAAQDEHALAYVRNTTRLAVEMRTFSYRLAAVRLPTSATTAELTPTDTFPTAVIFGSSADRQRRDMIVNYDVLETERVTCSLPGFRFAVFFDGNDDHDFAELAQWDSMAAFEAALKDPDFQEHVPVNERYAERIKGFHRVVAVAGTP